MPSQPIRLLVLFGGQSAEHDVSCTTAAHVLASADSQRYSIEPIGITKEGAFLKTDPSVLGPKTTSPQHDNQQQTASPPIVPLEPIGTATELMELVPQTPSEQQVVVLPLLHGPLGEDGTVQGLCELANVPFVGAGVLGSAVAMDKVMAKTVCDAHNIPQTKWIGLSEAEYVEDPEKFLNSVADSLGLPCFVKPANMGSSIGVSKAASLDELKAAIELALTYDEIVVVEESVVAREIEIAALGNDKVRFSVPGEIIPGAEFYDYEDKYEDGNADLVIPADLKSVVVDDMYEIALKSYRALRVEGMARVDFLYEEGGRGPLLNELNTIPGFTPISMYPKLWDASGLGYSRLIDELVDLAIERHGRRLVKRTTARSPRG